MFLSHNWGEDEGGRDNHQRVLLIDKELKRLGYQTWLDKYQMTGEIHDKMAEGIEQAKCVIVFVTRKYHDKVNSGIGNDNCRLEFSYATRKKTNKKMVAVLMEQCMKECGKWNGQLGLHLGGKLYIDMSGDVEDETYLRNQMTGLQRELLEMGIQPINNTDNKMVDKEPQPGIFLLHVLTYQYS